jgi:DNA-binding Lrp family transcriptional regulator
MSKVSSSDVDILMAVQYNLPLTEQPFVDLAEYLGVKAEDLLKSLRRLKVEGYIKRIGANANYKAFGIIRKACLVAFACDDNDVFRIADVINRSFNPLSLKHNFWREHDKYKVWFTVKGKSLDEIVKAVESVAKACGVDDYLILPSKRVYKMDVKYDLRKGISWSYGVEKENVPLVEDLGLDAKFLLKLQDLAIVERPFKFDGYKEGEVVDLIAELIKKGVFRDFSGVLIERKIGFKENGMNIVKTDKPSSIAKKLLKYNQITHLVEREVPEHWEYPLYFMVHADEREKIEALRDRIADELGLEIVTLYSKANLKPD